MRTPTVRVTKGAVYGAAVMLAALSAVLVLANLTTISADAIYVPLGCALAVGLLLTVRQAPGHPGAALILLPAIVADARLGLTALPALLLAAVATNLVRGVRGKPMLVSASHTVLAFTVGHFASSLLPSLPAWATFAVGFTSVRFALWHLAVRVDAELKAPKSEEPDVLLSLALAPVAVLPLLAADGFGDGALQDDLIHLITHELRNPLTLVMSYSQMTRRAIQDGSTDSIPTYINNVERAGRSIQRLMENLLHLSKLERSDSLPAAEPIQLSSIINQVVVDLAPLAKQKEQTLVVEPTQVDPALGVPFLLREALSNLVSNAVKYTPEHGEITVWAERGHETGTVVLGVRDTGIGLSADDLERLFTKFFRSSDTRVQRERGSGLGLALTHAVVNRMGGRLDVESTLGQGTTFRMTLPSRRAA